MRVGVFLDVDGVLTSKPINAAVAGALDAQSAFLPLEDRFNRSLISSDEFGRQLCEIFRGGGFTSAWIAKNWDSLPLRPGYAELIRRSTEPPFLVSSGPSYFVEELITRHGLAEERCLFSKYEFDDAGQLQSCSRPVTGQMKMEFVRKWAEDYDITVGVGDNPEVDGGFLNHCTVRLWLPSADADSEGSEAATRQAQEMGYLRVSSLAAIVDFIDRLEQVSRKAAIPSESVRKAVQLFHRDRIQDERPNIFIVTPFRIQPALREVVLTVKKLLEENGINSWTADEVEFSPVLWENVRASLHVCDAAVAIFVPERLVTGEAPEKRVEIGSAEFSPNVAIELGYILSMDKPALLLKEASLPNLPSDITGLVHRPFRLHDGGDSVELAITRWLRTFRRVRGRVRV